MVSTKGGPKTLIADDVVCNQKIYKIDKRKKEYITVFYVGAYEVCLIEGEVNVLPKDSLDLEPWTNGVFFKSEADAIKSSLWKITCTMQGFMRLPDPGVKDVHCVLYFMEDCFSLLDDYIKRPENQMTPTK